jgi:hypothetical protein
MDELVVWPQASIINWTNSPQFDITKQTNEH